MPTTQGKCRGTTLYHLVYAELVTAARYRGLTTRRAEAVSALKGFYALVDPLERPGAEAMLRQHDKSGLIEAARRAAHHGAQDLAGAQHDLP